MIPWVSESSFGHNRCYELMLQTIPDTEPCLAEAIAATIDTRGRFRSPPLRLRRSYM